MRRVFVLIILIALIGLISASPTEALTKKQRDVNFMSFYAGTSMPVGEYNGIPGDDFLFDATLYSFDADNVYDDAMYLGFDYGRLMGQWAFSFGFRYINHQLKDTIGNQYFSFFYNPPLKMNEYDIGLEMRYYLTDIQKQIFSPYVGLDCFTGFTTVGGELVDSENRITIALGATFGAEFKLMHDLEKKSFLTLASVNSFNFAASGDRPKYLHIGGALRYYFNN